MGVIHDGTYWEMNQITLEYHNKIDASCFPRLRSLPETEIKAETVASQKAALT